MSCTIDSGAGSDLIERSRDKALLMLIGGKSLIASEPVRPRLRFQKCSFA
jgi:hypothetical protein